MISLTELSLKMHSVSVMRDLLCDNVVNSLVRFLDMGDDAALSQKIDAYTEFVHSLYTAGTDNLSQYIEKLVLESENLYVKEIGKGETPSATLEKSFRRDLETFEEIASLTPADLAQEFEGYDFLPGWVTEKTELLKNCMARVANIGKYGYGIYAKYRMFYINDDYAITPVKNPDSVKLSDLVDYDREKKIIVDNTKALLEGKPAANVLLTGDAGTGKSSTIKAVVNELSKEGLRIIEVRKEQLYGIPKILDELSENPLKFILFIDDLSFAKGDDNFSALKAILEGSVSAKSGNVVIYATSNRRHIVKETFSDREGDDVHFNDTVQEILSLSERFGIQLTFQRPDKSTYLGIVHKLAEQNGIKYDESAIDTAAERFALKRGTRSARAAKHFIDNILSGNEKISE